MLGGSGLITVNDAIMKALAGDMPVGQVLCLRGVFALVLILPVVARFGGIGRLRIHDLGGQTLRASLVVGSTFLFVSGLAYLPLADAIAIGFAGPIFTTALAIPLLGERVGWRRWTAVFVGFLGILLMVRPTGEAVRLAALFPLSAALCGAFRDIVTRRIAQRESSIAILVFSTAVVTAAGAATLPFGWRPVTVEHLAWFVLLGLLMGGAQFLMIEALRLGEAGLVTPFKYSTLLWAMAIGLAVWGHVPAPEVLAGAALVAAAGLYILERERRVAQAARESR